MCLNNGYNVNFAFYVNLDATLISIDLKPCDMFTFNQKLPLTVGGYNLDVNADMLNCKTTPLIVCRLAFALSKEMRSCGTTLPSEQHFIVYFCKALCIFHSCTTFPLFYFPLSFFLSFLLSRTLYPQIYICIWIYLNIILFTVGVSMPVLFHKELMFKGFSQVRDTLPLKRYLI